MRAPAAFDFTGKRVIVGGGGGHGMGSAAVGLLLELGAEVHVLDLAPCDANVASSRQTDLGDPSDIAAAVAAIGGPVDALLNCQGVSNKATPDVIVRVNFLGTRELTERVLPLMSEGSAVATIASAGGLGWRTRLDTVTELVETPTFKDGADWIAANTDTKMDYAFSKEAVVVWTMLQSFELIGRGIRINCSSPGTTETPMKSEFRDTSVAFMLQPIGRAAAPVEQAWPLVFLVSEAASYINGENVVVDGGNAAAQTTGRLTLPT